MTMPGVCLIEWPEHAEEGLPGPDLRIRLSHHGAARGCAMCGETPTGLGLLSRCARPLGGFLPNK